MGQLDLPHGLGLDVDRACRLGAQRPLRGPRWRDGAAGSPARKGFEPRGLVGLRFEPGGALQLHACACALSRTAAWLGWRLSPFFCSHKPRYSEAWSGETMAE